MNQQEQFRELIQNGFPRVNWMRFQKNDSNSATPRTPRRRDLLRPAAGAVKAFVELGTQPIVRPGREAELRRGSSWKMAVNRTMRPWQRSV